MYMRPSTNMRRNGDGPNGWPRWPGQWIAILVCSWALMPTVLAQTMCMSDYDCQSHQFCRSALTSVEQRKCMDCLNCETQFNRQRGNINCAVKPLDDCGDCLPGYKSTKEVVWPQQHDAPTEVVSVMCKPDVFMMGAAGSTDQGAYDEVAEPEVVTAGTYVGFTVLGIVIGGTAGAAATASVCYCRMKKDKKKKKSYDKGGQKETEMQDLSPNGYKNATDDSTDHDMPSNGNGFNHNGNKNDYTHNGV